jgi:predicted O-linked N-acetylglucosamine transferase (SPINDLY family)
MWMGVPVLTLAGKWPASRAGVSFLSTVGLEQFIASTPEDFVRIGVKACSDLPSLSELRRGLRSRMQASPLCDAQKLARAVEAEYRKAWSTWCNPRT